MRGCRIESKHLGRNLTLSRRSQVTVGIHAICDALFFVEPTVRRGWGPRNGPQPTARQTARKAQQPRSERDYSVLQRRPILHRIAILPPSTSTLRMIRRRRAHHSRYRYARLANAARSRARLTRAPSRPARAQIKHATDAHGLVLVNPANICYANAVVQCLSMFPRPLSRVQDESVHSQGVYGPNCACVDCHLAKSVLELHHRRHDVARHPLGPLDVRQLITRVRELEGDYLFALGDEHDAAEFCRVLIERSALGRFFTWSSRRTMRQCTACGSSGDDHHGMVQFANESVMRVAAGSVRSTQAAVEAYESLTYVCPCCCSRHNDWDLDVDELPDCFILQLERRIVSAAGVATKDDARVRIDEHVDFQGQGYHLVSLVEHIGGFDDGSGHYVAWLTIFGQYIVRADDERLSSHAWDRLNQIEATLVFYRRDIEDDETPPVSRLVPLVPPISRVVPTPAPPRLRVQSPQTRPTRPRDPDGPADPNFQTPGGGAADDAELPWFEAPTFRGKKLKSAVAAGQTMFTRIGEIERHNQRAGTVHGHRPWDYAILSLNDEYTREVEILGVIGGRTYLVKWPDAAAPNLTIAIEVVPYLLSSVRARCHRRFCARHHDSPFYKTAGGIDVSIGYDSDATPVRNLRRDGPPENRHLVATRTHERQTLNSSRRMRAAARAKKAERDARAPPRPASTLLASTGAARIPPVPPHPGLQYVVPPVDDRAMIASGVIDGKRVRASNALDSCERFSYNMLRGQKLEYCKYCNEGFWGLRVCGAYNACNFCRKVKSETGSWPWRESNDTDAVSDEQLRAFAERRTLRDAPPPLALSSAVPTDDLAREGARLLPLLTLGEQMLVSRVLSVMTWWDMSCTAMGYAGHICNKVQNVDEVAARLPHDPSRVPLLLVRHEAQREGDTPRSTRVRAWVIAAVLHFLSIHSPAYNGTDPFFPAIEIDRAALARLPGQDRGSDGGEVTWKTLAHDGAQVAPDVYRGVPGADVGEVDDSTDDPPFESGVGRQRQPEMNQDELLQAILEHAATGAPMTWPSIGEEINEFTCVNYLAAAFPHLFPTGGCQYLGERVWQPKPEQWFMHLLRFKGGRFARDKRFRYLAHDTIARHSNIGTARAFVRKQYAGRTLNQLRDEIQSGRTTTADALARFVNHLPGNRAYWKRESNLLQSFDFFLQATYDQTFTIFYTLSHADLHCPDLHRMLARIDPTATAHYLDGNAQPRTDIDSRADYRARCRALINNPAVVAYHFYARATEFMTSVLKPVLNVVDFCRRFELQGRGITHEHGLARCAHAPKIEDLLLVVSAVQKIMERSIPRDLPNAAELSAVSRVIQWLLDNLPMTAMFPGTRPNPAAEGEHTRPDDASLRRMFSDLSDDELDETSDAHRDDQRALCLRCMMHKCHPADCKKPRRKDCICHGDATIECHKCRPPCKKGFDNNDACTGPCCPRLHSPPRLGRRRGARPNDYGACGCDQYVFFNVDGNRVEFSAPRDEPMLHVRVPILLGAWRANMDLRFCLDIRAVKSYIMKYAMKAEKMSRPFKDVMAEILKKTDETTTDDELQRLFTRFLNELTCERDFSAVEVCHMHLGLPMVVKSRQPTWLNLGDDALVPLAQPRDDNAADTVKAGGTTTYQTYLRRDPRFEELTVYVLASRFTDKYEPIEDHMK